MLFLLLMLPYTSDLFAVKMAYVIILIRLFGYKYFLMHLFGPHSFVFQMLSSFFCASNLLPDVLIKQIVVSRFLVIGLVPCRQALNISSSIFVHLLCSKTSLFYRRRQNYLDILKGLSLGHKSAYDLTNQFHHVFWFGDLNYRIDLKYEVS